MFPSSNTSKAPLVGAFLLFAACVFISAVFADAPQIAKVKYVVDGDTVIMENGDKVRLLGINAPEKEFEGRSAQPYSLEALLSLREMTEGQRVNLYYGRQQTDSYGRTLGYLESLEGIDLQMVLVSKGYAFVVAFPPDIDRLENYLDAEQRARADRLGVWKDSDHVVRDLDLSTKLNNGFGLFKGSVKSVSRSRNNVRFEFGGGLIATVRHADWKSFWIGEPEELHNKTVEFRGWIRKARDKTDARHYLRLRHPSMIKVIE